MTLEDPVIEEQADVAIDDSGGDKPASVSVDGGLRWWIWPIRVVVLLGMLFIVYSDLILGLKYRDPLVVYSTLMPAHTLIIFSISWLLYRNRADGEVSGDLVSVIIPIFNQKALIRIVIEAVFKSSYKNIEVIAVDDGSKDGTSDLLDEIGLEHPEIKIIHKENGGKRTAVATGFFASRGRYVVLMDSDSIIDPDAITELMKAFKGNPRVGGMVGNGKVWNAEKNLLTKSQSAWYDYCFNIHKKCESYFGTVLCCSGCLAAYRREAIADYIPYWKDETTQYSDDRQLTSYTIASQWAKRELAPIPRRLMESVASYDDAEDRGLTAQSLLDWETAYVPSAVVYTEVPETLKKFFRQQLRWKKGYLRTNFFVSAFFWRKNPVMALLYYIEFMTTFTSPMVSFIMLVYAPLVLHDYSLPLIFVLGQVFIGVAAGVDRVSRERKTVNWIYNSLMNIFLSLVLTWIIFPAIWTFREKRWLTR
ncbi:MAG: glycosyltransferase [Candidatus Bathyarchaeia archaeon]